MSIPRIVTVGIAVVVLVSGLGAALVSGLGVAAVAETDPGNAEIPAAQPSNETRATNATVQVTSSAELSASPDVATVRFAVVETADSAETARQRVADNASAVRDALRETGVEDDDVRTAYYDIGVVYAEDRSEIEGYRAIHAYEVTIDAGEDELANQTGSVVDTVVRNGADRVDGVEFGLSEAARGDLRQKALERAMASADRDAATLAAASDLTIAGVRSVSTTDRGVRPVDVAFREEDATGATVIEPGQVTVSVTVSVTYRTE